MASRAMTMPPFTPGRLPRAPRSASGGLGGGGNHLAAVVVAAGVAQMMRPLHLAAIGALVVTRGRERMMRAPHVAPGLRGFLLRNGHGRNSRDLRGAKSRVVLAESPSHSNPVAAWLTRAS